MMTEFKKIANGVGRIKVVRLRQSCDGLTGKRAGGSKGSARDRDYDGAD